MTRSGRPPMRDTDWQKPTQPRDSESVARASARAQSLLENTDFDTTDTDKYKFDRSIIPDGWDYEWKRNTIYNAEDPAYQVSLAKMGWEPVPVKRHPEFMPYGFKGENIERDGLILMERPAEITEKVQRRDYQIAANQVQQNIKQLNKADSGQFERNHKGDSLVKVKKSYEAVEIPD